MRIAALSVLPLEGPVGLDVCYVRVDTDTGLQGWGECSLPGKSNALRGATKDLEKLVIGLDALDSAYAWQRMYRHAFWRGGPVLTSAMSGIDIALWDLRGRHYETPVHKLLGGAVRRRIRAYANIGLSTSPDELRARAAEAIEQGYTAVKFYPLPAVDYVEGPATIRRIASCCEAVRDVLGEDRDFAVDLHGRPTAATAVQIERAIRDTHPLWIEEPVLPDVHHGLDRCAEKFVVPIATGERCNMRADFLRLMERGTVAVIQPDVANAGGITALAQLAAAAEIYGVAFAPHNPNGPIQTLASMHLAANAQAFSLLEHRPDPDGRMAATCSHVPAVDADGYLPVPSAPGIGATCLVEPTGAETVNDWIAESVRADGSLGDW